MRERLAVWSAATVFAGVFGTLAVLRHRAFESGRFDLGNMTQALWSTAHGDALSVTDVHGEQISRLGAHFDPLLVLLTPLWWLWPSPELLLVLQAVAVAAGALPVFWLARKHVGSGHIGSSRPAAALAVAYLLYPPTQWLVLSDFHTVALACPLLLFAWWHLDEGSLWAFALLAGAAIATKEHVGLAVAGIGVWYAVRHRARRSGAAIALGGAIAALLAALVVVPHFAPAGESAFESRYAEPSLGSRDLGYLAALLLPLALLPLAAPLAALAALPEVGLNMLSETVTQTSVKSHYAAVSIAALLVAAVFGATRVGGRVAYLAAAAALGGTVLVGPLGRVDVRADGHDAAARRALALIPGDAPVSATNSLGAHLSARKRIFSFPVLEEAQWVAVDTRRLTYLDSLKSGRARAPLAALERDPSFHRVFAEDGVLVFRRR
jgi:uncharacterized membrane protein